MKKHLLLILALPIIMAFTNQSCFFLRILNPSAEIVLNNNDQKSEDIYGWISEGKYQENEIIPDPDNENNHIFKVTSRQGANWSSLTQDVDFSSQSYIIQKLLKDGKPISCDVLAKVNSSNFESIAFLGISIMEGNNVFCSYSISTNSTDWGTIKTPSCEKSNGTYLKIKLATHAASNGIVSTAYFDDVRCYIELSENEIVELVKTKD